MQKVLKFMSRDQRISRFCWQLVSHVSLRIQGLPEETLRQFAGRQHELYVDLKKRDVSLADIGNGLREYILSWANRTKDLGTDTEHIKLVIEKLDRCYGFKASDIMSSNTGGNNQYRSRD